MAQSFKLLGKALKWHGYHRARSQGKDEVERDPPKSLLLGRRLSLPRQDFKPQTQHTNLLQNLLENHVSKLSFQVSVDPKILCPRLGKGFVACPPPRVGDQAFGFS
jgi:hypothetical protein